MKKIHNILKNVDILDLVNIIVQRDYNSTIGKFNISIVPLDETKRFYIDSFSKKVLEDKILERTSNLSVFDDKTKFAIQEFAGRYISEIYKHELCGLEDIPEAKDDPYADLRKKVKLNDN